MSRKKTPEALALERGRERQRRTVRLYGITLAQRDEMIEEQGGKCPICGSAFQPTGRRRPVIDHCHEKLTVRGILCHACNRGIGVFDDNPDALRSAARYLEG